MTRLSSQLTESFFLESAQKLEIEGLLGDNQDGEKDLNKGRHQNQKTVKRVTLYIKVGGG